MFHFPNPFRFVICSSRRYEAVSSQYGPYTRWSESLDSSSKLSERITLGGSEESAVICQTPQWETTSPEEIWWYLSVLYIGKCKMTRQHVIYSIQYGNDWLLYSNLKWTKPLREMERSCPDWLGNLAYSMSLFELPSRSWDPKFLWNALLSWRSTDGCKTF